MNPKDRCDTPERIRTFRRFSAVPGTLCSKTKLAKRYKLNAEGLQPVAKVYNAMNGKWIDLYSLEMARLRNATASRRK